MFGHDHHEETTLPEPGTGIVNDNSTTAPATDDNNGYLDDVSPAGLSPAPASDSGATSIAQPANDVTAPSVAPVAATASATASDSAPADSDKLLDIKQQALQQLTPLVGHLEQSPEEKFRTTMMMIQASDNHALVPAAYEAAQQITDEKARAQALLDIVNEINYFTHNGNEA